MASLEIRPLSLPDSAEDRLWQAWVALTYADSLEGFGDFGPPTSPKEALRRARGMTGHELLRWLALLDGEPVGFGRVGLDHANKPEGADVYVYVASEHRGNGIGPRLADVILGALSERTRYVDLELTTPPPGDGDAVILGPGGHGALRADAPGVKLALSRGFELGQVMLVNRYDFSDPTVSLADVLAETQREAGPDYEVRVFEDVAPPELADGIAVCKERMFTDVPAGAMHVHHPHWDAARLAEQYAQLTLTLRLFVAVAVHRPTGEVVALSELVHPRSRPTSALAQHDTIVLQEHRGHRLGLLVKAANMAAARAASPQASSIFTFNAAENTPMLAVNEALGFRPMSTHARFQLKQAATD